MNLFRVRGIQLAVHYSFFLFLAYYAFLGWTDDGVAGMFWWSAVLVTFFFCVVLHELGHSFTALHYGIGVRRILLMPIGGMAEFTSIPREPRREAWITLAGPAVNFAIAAVLWLTLPPLETTPETVGSFLELGHLLMLWNLLMGCFNLLPAFPMDGGRLLRAGLATRLTYLRATFWAATVGKVVAAVGFAAGAYFEQPMLMVLFGFIFFVGEMEYRAEKRREREETYYRERLARLYAETPPADEPPLLYRN